MFFFFMEKRIEGEISGGLGGTTEEENFVSGAIQVKLLFLEKYLSFQ